MAFRVAFDASQVGVENRFLLRRQRESVEAPRLHVQKAFNASGLLGPRLRGGESEQERQEAEAFRFHTGRGLTSAAAPATTACDATRGDWQHLAPPPVTKGTASLHGPTEASSSLAHPVYAPQGAGELPAPPLAPVAPVAAPGWQHLRQPQPLSNPFGARPALNQPLTSPFQAPNGA